MPELLSVLEAQQKILSAVPKREPESCSVEAAYGRVLTQNIHSPLELPPFTNSSMDGFAVRSEETHNASAASPVRLPVKLDIPAGFSKTEPLLVGTAARILTGAPLPPGADAVVQLENTDQQGSSQTTSLPETVSIFVPVKKGENTRFAGEDVKSGQLVLKSGRILQPQDIGLLISLGVRQVSVWPIPPIALFSSGDELLTPDQPLTPGKIYDSNGFVLAGILKKAGAEVIQLGTARDNPQSVVEILDKALLYPPDLIISSAGVSVGVFDYVRQVIEENGSLSFWRVNMRPGKPIAFGYYKNIPFIGLPGNPVSAYIGSLLFALPVIRSLLGLPPFQQKLVKAILTEALESPDGRESFYRGNIKLVDGTYQASLTGHQGSGNLFSLVQANALLIVPAGVKVIPAGEEVSAWALEAGLD
jgi:molybdopterin molybdotransferase